MRSPFLINLFSVGAARIINGAIALVTISYAARILGPDMYGLASFGSSLTAYAGIIALPGLATWATRAVAQDEENAGKILLIVNATLLILASIAYFLLIIFSFNQVQEQLERNVVLLSGLILFSTSVSVDWLFNGLRLNRITAILSVVNNSLYMIAILIFVKGAKDIGLYILLLPVMSLFTSAVGYTILLRKIKFHFRRPVTRDYFQLWRAALPLSVMLATVVVVHYSNNIIIKYFMGIGALGIFAAAYRLIELISSSIPGIIASVFWPRLAASVQRNISRAVKEAKIYARIHMIAAFFISGYIVVEAGAIIRVIYGHTYGEAENILRILALGLIFNFAVYGYTNCLIPFGKDKVMLFACSVAAVVSVVGGILLIPRFGLTGAAAVMAALDLTAWTASLPFYKRHIGSYQFRFWLMPVAGCAGMIASDIYCQSIGISFIYRTVISLLIYALLLRRSILNLIKECAVLSKEQSAIC
jgi:O-antigen/teichoic acid export membrane protein